MTLGRPRQYRPEQVLDAAMELFWQQGYEATSMQMLLGTMGLSKSSLYQTFGSKRQLFLLCLDRYQARTTADLRERLRSAESGLLFIEETLNRVVDEAERERPWGCLVVNTASEFSQGAADVAEQVKRGFDGYLEIFLTAVERAQREGGVADDTEAELLAGYLVTAMSGLRTMVKAGHDAAALRRVVAITLETLG